MPEKMLPVLSKSAWRGAAAGFVVGVLAAGFVLVVVWRCLPFYITYPPLPWPWYCTEPVYSLIGFLVFPVNLLTNDPAQAILLAPLSLLFYAIVGAGIGLALGWLRLNMTGRR